VDNEEKYVCQPLDGEQCLYKRGFPENRLLVRWTQRHSVLEDWVFRRLEDDRLADLGELIKQFPNLLSSENLACFDSLDDRLRWGLWLVDGLAGYELRLQEQQTLHDVFHVLVHDILLVADPRASREHEEHERWLADLRYTLRRWFRVLMDPQRPFHDQEGHEREEEMRKVLFENGRLRACFCEEPLRPLAEQARDWFLRRYDLVNAFHVLRPMPRPKSIGAGSGPSGGQPSPTGTAKGHPKASGSSGWKHSSWSGTLACFLLVAVLLTLFGLAWAWRERGGLPERLLGVDVGLCVAVGVLVCVFRAGVLLLPRLVGGLVVGYLVILPVADIWQWALQPGSWIPVIILAVLAGGGSLLYLHFGEVSRAVSHRGQAWARSLTIWFIGIAFSFFIGLVASWCVTPHLMQAKAADWNPLLPAAPQIPLWFHSVLFPVALVLQAAGALFVGLFVQILWEEKEITHPL